jgi:HSP20 family protein
MEGAMSTRKESAIARPDARDPFTLLRQMTSEFDRFFGEPALPLFRWPSLRSRTVSGAATWSPEIDVFEKDNRLVTKVDLPGLKREDVKVEVADGHLAISGERKTEAEETKDQFYRCEREYGGFYRVVPLPEGVKLEDVRASFSDGVLEVSVPLPVRTESRVRNVEIQEPPTAAKTAA